jgi:hypothetical protein
LPNGGKRGVVEKAICGTQHFHVRDAAILVHDRFEYDHALQMGIDGEGWVDRLDSTQERWRLNLSADARRLTSSRSTAVIGMISKMPTRPRKPWPLQRLQPRAT